MAVLQLQIEIDSDVQPELHAAVASIARSPARAERVRQLAAAGLIWEHVRAQGRPKSGSATTARTEPADPLTAASAPSIDADTAIDLDSDSRAPAAAANVPVLWDAVEDTAALMNAGARVADAIVQPTLRRTANSDVAMSLRAHPAHAGQESSNDAAPCRPDLLVGNAPPRKTGAKPRLLRMKEMGLFRNGPDA